MTKDFAKRQFMLGLNRACELDDKMCAIADYAMYKHFGGKSIPKFQPLGTFQIMDIFHVLWTLHFNTDFCEIAKKYPNVTWSQLNCLSCHTAMYVQSLALCKVYELDCIADGMREQQGFVIETDKMRKEYENLCHSHGVRLLSPVFSLSSDMERKMALLKRGFLPKTYEPQCLIGCPMEKELNEEQIDSLVQYFKKEITPHLYKLVAETTDFIIGEKANKGLCGLTQTL